MEIRTLEESPEELAAFVTGTWRADYGGRMVTPLWSAEYFDWQLELSKSPDRRQVLGAYRGTELIGALPGVHQTYLVGGEQRSGLLSSWLTVARPHRGAGVVRALKEEQSRRLQEGGGELILSYRYHGTRDSLADRPKKSEGDNFFASRWVGNWVRLLDARRAAGWYLNGGDRWLTRLGHRLLGKLESRDPPVTVREVCEEDLEPCLQLLSRAAAGATLAIAWDKASLRHQLMGGGPARGLVACREDQIVGLMSYHLLPHLARTEEPLGMIDLLVMDLDRHRHRMDFLKAALKHIQNEGAILAVKMNLGDLRTLAMVDSGFIPRRRDSLEVLRWLTPQAHTSLQGRQLVLWR